MKQNCSIARVALVVMFFALSGCATKVPSLYQWQGYQTNVDEYLRADKQDLNAQVRSMEEGLQKIQASGASAPPGYHAHLGLLYGKQGKADQFAQELQIERKLFPESETFVDFLLRNFKK